ncbi:hypothetical protein RRF57_010097 [Xylaria bambusicola]|uniref:Uncharacterized protein n=1 Tax=Xylaria bambusicola TaxID=326684 RepID=A0AAN7Z8B3_9PEZI
MTEVKEHAGHSVKALENILRGHELQGLVWIGIDNMLRYAFTLSSLSAMGHFCRFLGRALSRRHGMLICRHLHETFPS